jgi:hypothetical protein
MMPEATLLVLTVLFAFLGLQGIGCQQLVGLAVPVDVRCGIHTAARKLPSFGNALASDVHARAVVGTGAHHG